MRRATIVLPLLAISLAACSSTQAPGELVDTESEAVTAEEDREEQTDIGEAASDQAGPAEAEGTSDSAASGDDDALADEEASAEGSSDGDVAASEEPTPDPTIMAVAAAFELPVLGNPDTASLTIYEFSDFLCPYCAKFAIETLPEVIDEYVDSGQVALFFVDFPLQSHGYPALMGSEAAHCAGEQGTYWQMHDAIFEGQSRLAELISEQDERVVASLLQEMADEADLDGDSIRACLDSHKYRPIVLSLLNQAMESGVSATPTLLIGEEAVPGFLPFDDLKPIIEQELN